MWENLATFYLNICDLNSYFYNVVYNYLNFPNKRAGTCDAYQIYAWLMAGSGHTIFSNPQYLQKY